MKEKSPDSKIKVQYLSETLDGRGRGNQTIKGGERDQQKRASLIMSTGGEEERKMEC